MNFLIRFIKYFNSTGGILLLTVCWMMVFITFVGFTSLDDTETRFRDVFIPSSIQKQNRYESPIEKQETYDFINENRNIQRGDEIINMKDAKEVLETQLKELDINTFKYVANGQSLDGDSNNEKNVQKETNEPHTEKMDAPNALNYDVNTKDKLLNGNSNNEKYMQKESKKPDSDNIDAPDALIYNGNTERQSLEGDSNNEKNVQKETNEPHTEKIDASDALNYDVNTEAILNVSNINEEHVDTNVSKILHIPEATIYPFLNDSSAPGEDGKPFIMEKESLNSSEKAEYEAGWHNHQFNLYASDRISVRRSIPDYRSKGCKNLKYNLNLPKTSIVIVFHNEAWSTLLRSVHSIIDRSPSNMLKEIILVDDASTFEHLGSPLETYMKLLKIVKIIRSEKRVGLMKARIIGSQECSGDILTFLDTHIECYPGWLEPMLSAIYNDNKTVVCPVIDSLDENTLQPTFLSDSMISVGTFGWSMEFGWTVASNMNIERLTPQDPIKTPVMAGGLFSIQRDYFYKLGSYDPGMKIWGSENIEMSLRIWMCGGRLMTIPCSHVGHIFRSKSPYSWEESISKVIITNQRRLVEVWLDQYKEVYYAITGNRKKYAIGNISERVKLRKKLKCHSFGWYLKTIYPNLYDPLQSRFMGYIESFARPGFCFDTGNDDSKYFKLFQCHNEGGNQLWLISQNGFIRTIDKCFFETRLVLTKCYNIKNETGWSYDSKNLLIHNRFNNCLSVTSNLEVEILKCSFESPKLNQKWNFQSTVPFKLPYQDEEN